MLTNRQQEALDELFTYAQGQSRAARSSDFLKTWLGISSADVKTEMMKLLGRKNDVERRLVEWAEGNPVDAVFSLTCAAAAAFYTAERKSNPEVESYVDALYMIASSIWGGYNKEIAVTQSGRAIVTLVKILGPSFSVKTWNRPVSSSPTT